MGDDQKTTEPLKKIVMDLNCITLAEEVAEGFARVKTQRQSLWEVNVSKQEFSKSYCRCEFLPDKLSNKSVENVLKSLKLIAIEGFSTVSHPTVVEL